MKQSTAIARESPKMSEFVARQTALDGILLIEAPLFIDDRGFFAETWHEEKFNQIGITERFVQDNQSGSSRGVIRGLHYQIRQPQGKLVRVASGEIYDVVVDLRRNSPGFGKWEGMKLSSTDRTQLWIPPGFAHGFCVTSDWADVIYKVTDYYAPEFERTLLWNDPSLGVQWPLASIGEPVISAKDRVGLPFAQAEYFDLP